MSEESQNFSQNDKIRKSIQDAIDAGIDIKIHSNRTNIVKTFLESNTDLKPASVKAAFSKEFPKVGKAYNIDEDDLKTQPRKKFNDNLNINILEKKSGIGTVGIKNPKLDSNQSQSLQTGSAIQSRYEIKQSQIKAFCDALYGLLQLPAKDLPDMTEEEANDLGDLWQPVAQNKLGNSDRGQYALAVGGTSGILIKKVRQAKKIKKERIAKEESEKKAQSAEKILSPKQD